MRKRTIPLAVSTLIALIAAASTMAPLSAQSAAHRHIGHVADMWNDTPDNMGLLPAAQAEAEVAAQHAKLAAAADDLAGIQRHIMHVVHAVNASVERGPGSGYGLLKAASAAARHIGMAGESDGASDAVKTHSMHVKTSVENVIAWAESIAEKAEQIAAATDADAARAMAEEIAATTEAIVSGIDANGDGRVSWGEGEGGLAQAATHLRLMKQAEGIG